ncbi:MAG TPA: multiheme c-type cytochrome, partial [Kofleriaceae bacterium]|nr:multiheme c-type cytochrome [Kofleriaceae bacterium]
MRGWLSAFALALATACNATSADSQPKRTAPAPPPTPSNVVIPARLPSAPGEFAPSLVVVTGAQAKASGPDAAQTRGELLSDSESCSACHADAAAQWGASAHSFASFGNPIYRANIELARTKLGKAASRHCGGCHDMPLVVDGFLTAASPVPAADLRAHSGVTCRLCHGMSSATNDGNASYVWNAKDLDAPVLTDPASVAKHKAAASVRKLGDDMCISCHRGFLSPDMGMPAHLLGIDEPTAWRSS